MLNVKNHHILLSNSPLLSPPLSPSRPLPTAVGGGGEGYGNEQGEIPPKETEPIFKQKGDMSL